jgi:hypothetical protein
MFYPNDAERLRNDILNYLNHADVRVDSENIFGIVSPHAGYVYSGPTAAYGFKLIENKDYNKVIVLSPSHRMYFAGSSIYSGDAYLTPLGEIPVDKELRSKITEDSKTIFSGLDGHSQEHALEVQLPFLQVALGEFSLVPIVIGDQSSVFVYELADRIAQAADDKTLVVASSDLSHFYNKETADKLDSVAASDIEQFNYEKLQSDLETHNCEACGGGTIVSMLKAAKQRNMSKADVLARSDSGDVSGDNSEVVGYLSAVVYA